MRRIRLAVVLTIGLVAATPTSEGQQTGKVYRIGYLSPSPPVGIEGSNVAFEYRWAHNDHARLPGLAKGRPSSRVSWRASHGLAAISPGSTFLPLT